VHSIHCIRRALIRLACLLAVFVAVWANAQEGVRTFAYVANNFSNSVSVIDTNTESVVAAIAVGSVPTELAISVYRLAWRSPRTGNSPT
jgi:YVTN family beta-propeller protein